MTILIIFSAAMVILIALFTMAPRAYQHQKKGFKKGDYTHLEKSEQKLTE